jgi:hypothetical protein
MHERWFPLLYQINTRVWLTDLSRKLGRRVTLDDIPGAELDRLAGMGFDWIWLLSIWTTGPAGQRVSRSHADWRREFEETLPDLQEQDIGGSGFAIAGYTVSPALGGDSALARLRTRLRSRGLRLMLDFVPNHTALDHPWVELHPEYYVAGSEADLARAPQNYTRLASQGGARILAHGRDPYFDGWPDTLQLNYGDPAFQDAMIGELTRIAGQCDGLRCDMAMLVLPEIFVRTWGIAARPFWPRAIAAVRERVPDFVFMAEVYWDLEWNLLQQGFDYSYDKRLYDRLRDGSARPVREHLIAGLDFQSKLARFLENHDEPRAAAVFPPGAHEAAATITYLCPGLRFFHQGQLQGRRKRISPHLCRGPEEPVDPRLEAFYSELLAILRNLALRQGEWELLNCSPAWEGNWTWECGIAFCWHDAGESRLLVFVNYAANQSQCYVELPFQDLRGSRWRLRDLLGPTSYVRDGDDLHARGLFLDVPAWQSHVFQIEKEP